MNKHYEELKLTALEYLDRGFSVIPIGVDKDGKFKKSLVKWKDFQKKHPTKDEVEGWFVTFPNIKGIALVTGKISNLFVLDIEEGVEYNSLDLPITPKQKTGGGGVHFFMKYPKDSQIGCFTGFRYKMDIRGEGGYAVIAPSLHHKGTKYKLESDLNPEKLAEVPQWLIEELNNKKKNKKYENLFKGVPEGERSDQAAIIIGKLIIKSPIELWETKIWPQVLDWNKKNIPPLTVEELRSIFNSITGREKGKLDNRKLDLEKGLALLEDSNLKFFHDQHNKVFVRVENAEGSQIINCESKVFNNWLQMFYYSKVKKVPSCEVLKSIQSMLIGKALYEGKSHNLDLRVAKDENGAFIYQLHPTKDFIVETTPLGWEIKKNEKILFKTYSHQKPQVNPIKEGNINNIFNFIRIKDKDERLLFLSYLVSCFVPNISHPALLLFGEKGSSKSTTFKLIRKIVDPSALELLGISKNSNELIQQLSHNYCAFYDNLDGLTNEYSNIFCRAVTGEAGSKRTLYSDEEDSLYSFKTCIGLNGIHLVANKSDLLDRSILLELTPIPSHERKTDTKLYEDFNEQLPSILGGIFDILSKAMKCFQPETLSFLERMADFTQWGYFIAEAQEKGKGDLFLAAYKKNLNKQTEELINNNFVISCLIDFLSSKPSWEGTSTELLSELGQVANTNDFDVRSKYWPKEPNSLSRKIAEFSQTLEKMDIICERNKGLKRILKFYKKPSLSSKSVSNPVELWPNLQ